MSTEQIILGKVYLYFGSNAKKHILVPIRFAHQDKDVLFYDLQCPDKEEIGSLAWAKKYWSEIK